MADIADQATVLKIGDLRAEAHAAEHAGRRAEAAEKLGQAVMLETALAKLRERRDAKFQSMKVAKLIGLAKKYRAAARRLNKKRPSLADVAEEFGWDSEQPLRDYCRDVGIASWHDVHALMAAAGD